jgi:hypothetical protein
VVLFYFQAFATKLSSAERSLEALRRALEQQDLVPGRAWFQFLQQGLVALLCCSTLLCSSVSLSDSGSGTSSARASLPLFVGLQGACACASLCLLLTVLRLQPWGEAGQGSPSAWKSQATAGLLALTAATASSSIAQRLLGSSASSADSTLPGDWGLGISLALLSLALLAVLLICAAWLHSLLQQHLELALLPAQLSAKARAKARARARAAQRQSSSYEQVAAAENPLFQAAQASRSGHQQSSAEAEEEEREEELAAFTRAVLRVAENSSSGSGSRSSSKSSTARPLRLASAEDAAEPLSAARSRSSRQLSSYFGRSDSSNSSRAPQQQQPKAPPPGRQRSRPAPPPAHPARLFLAPSRSSSAPVQPAPAASAAYAALGPRVIEVSFASAAPARAPFALAAASAQRTTEEAAPSTQPSAEVQQVHFSSSGSVAAADSGMGSSSGTAAATLPLSLEDRERALRSVLQQKLQLRGRLAGK